MPQNSTARPVSGEIMANAPRARKGFSRLPQLDVVDAEFEIIRDDGPEARPDPDQGRAAPELAMPSLGMLSKSPRRTSRHFAVPGGIMFWCGGLALVAGAFWISGGHTLVTGHDGEDAHAMTAEMRLEDVVSRVDFSGAKPIIFVDGHVSNASSLSATLPGLEIRVSDLHGLTTSYKLGTSSRRLEAGEQYAFSSRLDVPKNGVKTVAVTFAE